MYFFLIANITFYRYENGVAADHWFEPVQVWEIKCADLSVSPVHKAAIGIVSCHLVCAAHYTLSLKMEDV